METLTPAQLAATYNLPVEVIQDAIQTGELRADLVDGEQRIMQTAFDAWLATKEVPAAPFDRN